MRGECGEVMRLWENWGKDRAIVEVLGWWFGRAYGGTVIVESIWDVVLREGNTYRYLLARFTGLAFFCRYSG